MDIDAVHVNTSDIDNCVFFFKQKTAYEMLISDWSSDVCSSDLAHGTGLLPAGSRAPAHGGGPSGGRQRPRRGGAPDGTRPLAYGHGRGRASFRCALRAAFEAARPAPRGDRPYPRLRARPFCLELANPHYQSPHPLAPPTTEKP